MSPHLGTSETMQSKNQLKSTASLLLLFFKNVLKTCLIGRQQMKQYILKDHSIESFIAWACHINMEILLLFKTESFIKPSSFSKPRPYILASQIRCQLYKFNHTLFSIKFPVVFEIISALPITVPSTGQYINPGLICSHAQTNHQAPAQQEPKREAW